MSAADKASSSDSAATASSADRRAPDLLESSRRMASSAPALLHDASAPQPDYSGWRVADSLAELGLDQTTLPMFILFAFLGAVLAVVWHRRRATRARAAAALKESAGCHIG